jgi:lipopolysaccharide export system protein LptA
MTKRLGPVTVVMRVARLAALAMALGGAGPAWAQGFAGVDSNAPVDYAADRIEVQDRAHRVVLSGNVDITQGDLRLRAQRITVNYTRAGSLQIQRMIAGGGVQVQRGNQSARGDVAVYDLNRRIITMAGNVALNRGGDTLNGGRLVINLATGVSSVDGQSSGAAGIGGTSRGGRVSGTFSAPKPK